MRRIRLDAPLRHRPRSVRRREVITLSWLTPAEAAREIGVSEWVVRQRAREHGWTIRRLASRRILIADHCVKAEAEAELCECADAA